MDPIQRLQGIILDECTGAREFDPTMTPSNAFLHACFSLRLESGEKMVEFTIPKGAAMEGRKGITRVEQRFNRETGESVYVKLV